MISIHFLYIFYGVEVPQDSILGPLLFLIYVNDMPLSSSILSFILFADDTTSLYSCPSPDELFATLNNELIHLQTWFLSNKLLVNANKTNLVLFTTRQKRTHLSLNENHRLTICNTNIETAESVKFLGLQLNSTLDFKNHFQYICSKTSKGLYALKRASRILNTKDLKVLYYALIYPYLTYGLLVWGGTCRTHSQYRTLNAGAHTRYRSLSLSIPWDHSFSTSLTILIHAE